MKPDGPIVHLRREVADQLRERSDAMSFRALGGLVDIVVFEELGDDPDELHRLSRRPLIVIECIEGNRSLRQVFDEVRELTRRLRDQRVEAERQEISVSLVVCLLDPPAKDEPGEISQEDLKLLKEFAEREGPLADDLDGNVRLLYVMTPRLHDAGSADLGLVDARDAWPLAVDRLVASLVARPDRLAGRSIGLPLRAWWMCELLTPWEAASWGRVRQQLLERIWPAGDGQAAKALELPALREDSIDNEDNAPRAAIPRFAFAGSIFGTPGFADSVRQAYASRRVENHLHSRVMGVSHLAPLAEATAERIRQRWRLVREEPGNLDDLKRAWRRIEEASQLDEMLATIEDLRGHHRRVDIFQRRVADLEEAGEELDLARRRWLVWWWRLVVAGVIAMLAGYVVYGLIRPLELLDDDASGLPSVVRSPVFVATLASSILGAVAGAMVPFLLEWHRGRRARTILDSGADARRPEYSGVGATPVQSAITAVGDSLQSMMRNAATLRRTFREIATASMLRWGAQRLTRVKERAVADVLEEAPTAGASRDRERYARAVRFRCSDDAAESALSRDDAEVVRPEAENAAHIALSDRWKTEAPRLDPIPGGLWPAHPTHRVLQSALLKARRDGERVILQRGLRTMEESVTTLDIVAESYRRSGRAALQGGSLLSHPLLSVRYNVRGQESGAALEDALLVPYGASSVEAVFKKLGRLRGDSLPLPSDSPPAEVLATWIREVPLEVVPEGDHLEFIVGTGGDDGA
jgi:hypothetical protein